LIVFTLNEHENICIAGLKHRAGYVTALFSFSSVLWWTEWLIFWRMNINQKVLHVIQILAYIGMLWLIKWKNWQANNCRFCRHLLGVPAWKKPSNWVTKFSGASCSKPDYVLIHCVQPNVKYFHLILKSIQNNRRWSGSLTDPVSLLRSHFTMLKFSLSILSYCPSAVYTEYVFQLQSKMFCYL
jgi:hypothetical protein